MDPINNKPDFTCICCRVAFYDGETQRKHYRTDWHRYNLKRKVVDLPSVTSEEFDRRVLTQKKNNEEQAQTTSKYCKCCRKSYSNESAYANHLNSKRHKENDKNYVEKTIEPKVESLTINDSEADEEVEEVDSDEWDEDSIIDVTNCIFCRHHSKNLMKNLTHMSSAHTFFIPDIEYCIDVEGLIAYLAEKVEEGFMCLWCNESGKTFQSAQSARRHMLDKGHCKMLHEGITLAEYTEFYDYSSSYPDAAEPQVDADEEIEVPNLEEKEYQLVLPSGTVIGHRSLLRYYKQNFNPNRAIAPVNKKLHKVLSTYRALGWSPSQQEAAARRARDIHHMKRLYTRYAFKLSLNTNKFQPHFRPQVNF